MDSLSWLWLLLALAAVVLLRLRWRGAKIEPEDRDPPSASESALPAPQNGEKAAQDLPGAPIGAGGDTEWLAPWFERASVGIARLDTGGKVLQANSAWARMHGFEPGEIQGHHLSLFHTPDQMIERMRPWLYEVLEDDLREGDVGHRRKDGSTFVAWTSLTLLRDDRGEPMALTVAAREIRRPRETIEGSISDLLHEFNNLLTGILGNASLALHQLPEDAAAREPVREIDLAAREASELISAFEDAKLAPVPDPRARAIQESTPVREPASPRAGSKGTVLVVDDHAVVRNLAANILEGEGYAVLTADDGEPALQIFRERQREISAVLLDLSMPRVDGRETLRRIRDIAPSVKVVMMTGHSEDDARESLGELRNDDALLFLQKPFEPEELLTTLRRILEVPAAVPD